MWLIKVRGYCPRRSPAIKCLLIALLLFPTLPLVAEAIPVRLSQGTCHGFLTVRDANGSMIATGDLVQVVHGERVVSHVTYKFRDGSLDDETTVFTQRKTFQLISDRHIQRGPYFPKAVDMQIQANGDVTSRDADGKVEKSHFDLPAGTSNGMLMAVMTNISSTSPETSLMYLAPTGKGRLVKVTIRPDGEDQLLISGVRRKAVNFRLHIELGGIAGLVAPVIGKQPQDIHVWVLGGEAPAFVKEEGWLYEGGPTVRIELASPTWPVETAARR